MRFVNGVACKQSSGRKQQAGHICSESKLSALGGWDAVLAERERVSKFCQSVRRPNFKVTVIERRWFRLRFFGLHPGWPFQLLLATLVHLKIHFVDTQR